MSTMKDKLANSVRQAKSGARPAAEPSGTATRAPEAPATAAEPTAPAATPVASKPAAAATIAADKRAPADTQNPKPSTKELFPRRVWPD